MEKQEFFEISENVFEKNGVGEFFTGENRDKFFSLCNIMLEQNKVMNLSAIRDEHGVICRHFADSLTAAKHIKDGATVLDVGSGGGMPTLPLAIARHDLTITALDATAKKTAYIKGAAEKLSLSNVNILTGRAEELGAKADYREKFDIVTARAVASLRVLLEWCIPFLKTGGTFIAMKGKNGDEELKEAQTAAKELSLTLLQDDCFNLYDLSSKDEADAVRHIFVFKKNLPTKKIYPRKNSQIQKNPL